MFCQGSSSSDFVVGHIVLHFVYEIFAHTFLPKVSSSWIIFLVFLSVLFCWCFHNDVCSECEAHC